MSTGTITLLAWAAASLSYLAASGNRRAPDVLHAHLVEPVLLDELAEQPMALLNATPPGDPRTVTLPPWISGFSRAKKALQNTCPPPKKPMGRVFSERDGPDPPSIRGLTPPAQNQHT